MQVSKFLQKNSERSPIIHVVGDSMIDEVYNVRVTRISPESPNACVMLSETEKPTKCLPGGAANVCYQLKNFNVQASLFCFHDWDALKIWESQNIIFKGIGLCSDCCVPRKKRYYHEHFQVGNRWDVEKFNYGLTDDALQYHQKLLYNQWIKNQKPEVIILSDYNKGIFSKCNGVSYLDHGITTIVDPKRDLEKWRGCTIFKPNAAEAHQLSGISSWQGQCDYFMTKLGCQAVVITQQGDGIVGKDGNNFFEYRPLNKVQVYQTSGAGDCFVAILALAIAHGFSVRDASVVAYEAGVLFVQQTQPGAITPWQLQKKSKFATISELQKRDYKLVFTNGCFDILHSGHLESLRFAKSKGDKLVVAVNSDSSVARLKGSKRPVVTLCERMEILVALEYVDYVISFDEDSPYNLVKEIKPDVLIKGADWENKPVAGTEFVKEVYFVPLIKDRSTTNIIDKIRKL